MQRLFRQFSFPGGIPSHVAPETPGSIHEGGELGYALAHAFGAAFDNPDLLVACVVGDGEAETGPLATSWHSNKFLDPARDGAVLPILHLNGYKIANPTVLARIPRRRARRAARGLRLRAVLRRRATTRPHVHQQLAATLDAVLDEIAAIQRATRADRSGTDAAALADDRAAHAQGLDRARRWSTACRSRARGARTRCRWPRSARTPEHLALLEDVAAVATGPRSCSTTTARCVPSCAALAPTGDRRMSANPHANGGVLLRDLRPARLPRLRRRRSRAPATPIGEATRVLGDVPARRDARATPTGTSGSSARTRPPRTGSAPCSRSPTAAWMAEIDRRATTTSPPTAG